ncbi:dihydrodipicolinate synthase family protein [Aminobacter sp. SR38]|jgi:4-hydroxy-tetrahydrodipicolinate synthase|uniref:dihydrodipicolinate synthase family protein n=1 Tax=Aminobacter sp. SR38 TaxID=2774562 RepID=UPI00177D0E6E|nr:dihydrodipicolinate synthase family protein [Aminobacter sp. SR38]QOF73026.1 dihydrodipicolinate synthase family protein [Aminobacter sp. SR38]
MPRFAVADMHGIHAILYALFDDQEKLDRSAMRRQVELCLGVGVHGMAALGLATEASKLTDAERRMVMDWIAEDTGGKVPLALTIFGASVAEQIAQVRHAESVGADWLILQPPMVGQYGAAEYIRFFGRVAEATDLPVAIQNAPAFMGRGLSSSEISDLVRQHPNIQLVKGEGPVVDIAGLVEATGGKLPIFNGRAGLEMLDNLRIGCRGLILAPDCIDYAVAAYDAFVCGDEQEALLHYRTMLPAVVSTMQGIEHLMAYGKRLFASRAGLLVQDRTPALRPNAVGLAMIERFATDLGPLRRRRPDAREYRGRTIVTES